MINFETSQPIASQIPGIIDLILEMMMFLEIFLSFRHHKKKLNCYFTKSNLQSLDFMNVVILVSLYSS